MEQRKTDLEAIKQVALSFLYIDVDKTEFAPIVVAHPIFESGIQCSPHTKKMINIFEDEEGFNEILDFYDERIRNEKTFSGIYLIIRDAYKLAFIKFIKDYLSPEDYGNYLADAWTISENPNQDTNVSLKEAADMFKEADKKYLMSEDELEVYQALPDEFTIYRGVARGRNPKGMSWTRSRKKADWFANRFNLGDEVGYVQAATAHKKDVLAYFGNRNEDEYVISTKSLNDIHVVE